MAGSSCKSKVIPGENYLEWSGRMKKDLISEGLWVCVDEGCRKPNETEGIISAVEMEEMKQEMVNDAKALSLIRQSLPPAIFVKIFDATTAKEAWETLHSMFQDESCGEFVKSYDPCDEDEDGSVIPLSGNKPFFDIVLMKSALKPLCNMTFPSRVNSILPSTNVVAKVRMVGRIHEIYFYGRRKQKSFGAGWRQLLEQHHLMVGDFLVFEILESTRTNLHMNMQILRPTNNIQPTLSIHHNIDDDE